MQIKDLDSVMLKYIVKQIFILYIQIDLELTIFDQYFSCTDLRYASKSENSIVKSMIVYGKFSKSCCTVYLLYLLSQ